MRLIQAVKHWLDEGVLQKKRSIQNQREQLAWICKHFNQELSKINGEWVAKVRMARVSQTGQRGKPLTAASVNRYMSALSAVLHYAHRMEWIETVPYIPYMREDNERRVWLTANQAQRLLEELPAHLEPMAAYSLATGVRQANCTGLEWAHINIETKRVRVPGAQFKQGVVFSYPLNAEACTAIARANHTYRHPRLVFHYRGQRIINPGDKAWRKAIVRADLVPGKVHGLEEGQRLRWHDLRHTWATWHVMAGTPVHVLKELGGWRTTTVVERYYHLSETFTSTYAENVLFRNIKEICHS